MALERNPAIETDPFRGSDDAVKQQAKIDFMRRRNADRVKRLLNSKQRAIGADPAALARQIQEREEAKLEEQEETQAYVEYEAHMRDVVEEREQSFKAQDRDFERSLAKEWDGEVAERAERRAKIASEDLRCDPAKTGPAGAQVFEGEDPTAEERTKLQNLNVRSWLAQQEAEKAARVDEEKDELLRYAAYERFVAAERADLEDEENEERSRVRYELRVKNEEDAERRRAVAEMRKREVAQIEAAEIDRRLSDPELCENTAVARSALGAHRYRPDHFKGFAREQVAQLLKVLKGQLLQAEDDPCDAESHRGSESAEPYPVHGSDGLVMARQQQESEHPAAGRRHPTNQADEDAGVAVPPGGDAEACRGRLGGDEPDPARRTERAMFCQHQGSDAKWLKHHDHPDAQHQTQLVLNTKWVTPDQQDDQQQFEPGRDAEQ